MFEEPELPMEAGSAVVAAAHWAQAALLGALATSLAVIAIGFIGLRLLSGRETGGGAIRVIAGCFILFGAPSIASGLIAAAKNGYQANGGQGAVAAPAAVPTSLPKPSDPYAGASAQGL